MILNLRFLKYMLFNSPLRVNPLRLPQYRCVIQYRLILKMSQQIRVMTIHRLPDSPGTPRPRVCAAFRFGYGENGKSLRARFRGSGCKLCKLWRYNCVSLLNRSTPVLRVRLSVLFVTGLGAVLLFGIGYFPEVEYPQVLDLAKSRYCFLFANLRIALPSGT